MTIATDYYFCLTPMVANKTNNSFQKDEIIYFENFLQFVFLNFYL